MKILRSKPKNYENTQRRTLCPYKDSRLLDAYENLKIINGDNLMNSYSYYTIKINEIRKCPSSTTNKGGLF